MNLEHLIQYNITEAQRYCNAVTNRLTQMSRILEKQGIEMIRTCAKLKRKERANQLLESQNNKCLEKLTYLEKSLQALLKTCSDAVFHIDKKGVCLAYSSPKLPNNLPESIFIGNKLEDVMPSSISNLLKESVRATFLTNSLQSFDFELFEAGTHQYYQAQLSPINADNALLIIRNTTETIVAKEAIKKSGEYFCYLMKAAKFPIILHDRNGKIIEINQEALNVLGYKCEKILQNNSFLRLIDPSDRLRAKRILREGYQSGFSTDPAYFKAKRSNGLVINVEVVASVIHFRGQLLVQIVFKRVSKTVAQKRSLRYLEKYKQAMGIKLKV